MLNDHVNEMKALAKRLVPYTYPNVPYQEEFEILPLKIRTFVVDGYHISATYNCVCYKKSMIESVQIQGIYTPFLPFILVCKIGKAFLGSENLGYIEFMRDKKKIYCWTVHFKQGHTVPPKRKSTLGNFEGLDYRILHPGVVNLYEI